MKKTNFKVLLTLAMLFLMCTAFTKNVKAGSLTLNYNGGEYGSIVLAKGETSKTFSFILSNDTAKSYSWSTGNTSVAKVSSSSSSTCTVTAVGEGTTNLYFTLTNTSGNPYTLTVPINVYSKLGSKEAYVVANTKGRYDALSSSKTFDMKKNACVVITGKCGPFYYFNYKGSSNKYFIYKKDVNVNTNIAVEATTNKKLKVAWNRNWAATYKLYRKAASESSYKLIKTFTDDEATFSYTDSNVDVGAVYYYKVLAVYADGRETYTEPVYAAPYFIDKVANLTYFKKNFPNVYIKGEEDKAFKNDKGTIRYLFDGETLTVYLNIKFMYTKKDGTSVEFSRKTYNDGGYANILNLLTNSEGNFFEPDNFKKGVMNGLNNLTIIGTKNNFNKHSFKTKVVIYEKDKNNSDKNDTTRQYISVYTSGLYGKGLKRAYALGSAYKKASSIFMQKQNLESYLRTSMHEMGHILSLRDAYLSDDKTLDRMTQNIETCKIGYVNGIKKYYNLMICNLETILPNDLEIALYYDSHSDTMKMSQNGYKTYNKDCISSEKKKEHLEATISPMIHTTNDELDDVAEYNKKNN